MRLACDTGGTFTDLVVEDGDGRVSMYKSATVRTDPARGVLDALRLAADARGQALDAFLARGEIFIHGTTHAINAIITGNTAKTALLVTAGHPDMLVIREGGRSEPFNQTVPFPEPYIPRALTFEIPERVTSNGAVTTALEEVAVSRVLDELREREIEAVAVCLLWSIVNPVHELRIGEMLSTALPDIPYTLSHQLNPTLREYRRASATAMDASLKPLMGAYMAGLTDRLAEAGFKGRLQVLTSQGGMMDGQSLADAPIHAINSGPSMAPLAGRHYARSDGLLEDIIVADTGGTTYDVSLVRGDDIPWSRETWIGEPFRGHMTGFPSVDVKSVGAGGGSVAWVDSGGMLHIGPESAGANPGPACYDQGGDKATVTDAAVALGYIDPNYFLAGSVLLNKSLAMQAIEQKVAEPLGLDCLEAAAAIIDLATENMVQAITDITVNQGIDPASAILIGGGGAAGLNSIFIARRLGCGKLIIPEVGAALSAAGALMSDLSAEFRTMHFTVSDSFDFAGVSGVIKELGEKCAAFANTAGKDAIDHQIEFSVEARYRHQVWEIEVPLRGGALAGPEELSLLLEDFHTTHESVFGFRDERSVVEMIGWTAKVRCRMRRNTIGKLAATRPDASLAKSRRVYLPGEGDAEVPVYQFDALHGDEPFFGPAIIESPFTTIIVDRGPSFFRSEKGSLIITIEPGDIQ